MLTTKEIIKLLAEDGSEKYSKVCTVKSINGLNCDCSPIDGDADILDVRLVADESEKFFVLIPEVGSIVIVGFVTKECGFISMVSKVSEIKCRIGNSWFSMDSTGYLIKQGDDTLKQVIQLIIEAVQAILVLQGNNPDFVKLAQANIKLNNILR